MARAGLGSGWSCVFANDIDLKKERNYIENWGGSVVLRADVAQLNTSYLPGTVDLS